MLSRELVEVIKGFSRYIAKKDNPGTAISVGISKDHYHRGADPDAAFDFYRRELAGVATVKLMRRGDVPVSVGRGRGLPEARPLPIEI